MNTSVLPAASSQLSIVYRPANNLVPDPRNARTHPKRQIEQLKASIKEFGFTNPILVDPDSNIIAGHGRLQAAKALGLAQVPTITLSGLSETQKRTLRLADNKIALNAGWDIEILQAELGELASIDLDIDATLTGFSTGEIDVIVSRSAADPDDEVIPAAPRTPKARPGDIWILGEHRIGCGDSRDAAFLERVVGKDARIDAAFLDPPYNVRIEGNANPTGRHGEFAMASGEMSEDQFRAFLKDTLGAAASFSRDGAVHFICMDWRHMDDVTAVGSTIYGDLLNLCIWNKSNAGMGSLYRSKHELVFVYRVGSASHLNMVELGKHGRNRTNVWDYASANSMRGGRREDLALHPTVKPVGLVADAIKDVTKHGDLVLDLFLGSGTTLLAAERAGRRFRGIEIDPKYVDVALERWSAQTGLEPRLEGAGS
ncbi:site-specific DNA-methyltransferase [Bradyrhizobium barranii subsp. apii]|uniref:Methyltransferase n=1 Tax=Bradyrhizobium barranii subsp. apii TaxID=2819348 RepID=A0A8T5VB92_9BRAD|nr:site-specific DNA-methyltransferase [Bradyrhizobium barranii]UPT91745.1 site-specific DNA-methyltransferase [Bradyrhizobium barranii subsp. apii]